MSRCPCAAPPENSGDLGVLIRLFLLADDCPAGDVAAALAPLTIAQCVDAGLLEGENFDSENPLVRAAVDLRPIDVGDGDRWVISDLDGGIRPKKATADHVLGVGHASLSLLQATPTARVGSVLDLGTGCGIQALHANTYADSVTATDINQRAVDLTAATMALNGLDVELLQGSWFEPVEGRTFDQVVANPPFVVGEARVHHTYPRFRPRSRRCERIDDLAIDRLPEPRRHGSSAGVLGARRRAGLAGRGSRRGCRPTASMPGWSSAMSRIRLCTSARGSRTAGRIREILKRHREQTPGWITSKNPTSRASAFGFVFLSPHRLPHRPDGRGPHARLLGPARGRGARLLRPSCLVA